MVKLVIFDFDGTLADSKEVSISIYNRLAQKYNLKLIDNIEDIRRLPLLERFKSLGISIYKLPLLAADFTKQYKSFLKNISLFTGMKELLIELKRQGYELAIVSSNSESNIREFLRENLLDVIGTIINSTNIMGKDKVIKKLLTNNNLNPLEVLYVGDEIRDIIACKKLGIKIVWVDWGYDLLEMAKERRPDYVAGSPQDILPILSNL
jgi:phosphoglycolate phosphatase